LACRIAGVEPVYERIDPDEGEIPALVASLNAHRRHLTREEKQRLVEAVLSVQFERSDRSIAKAAGVDHKTVASVRKSMVQGGEIPQVHKRLSQDGAVTSVRPPKKAPGMWDVTGAPRELQEIMGAAKLLNTRLCKAASQDTPVGRAILEAFRRHQLELIVNQTPTTDMGSSVPRLGRQVTSVRVIEKLRTAILAAQKLWDEMGGAK
jgi:hypothetical protein